MLINNHIINKGPTNQNNEKGKQILATTFFAPPYQPCHILHGKSVVTYRHLALLHLAELSIASSMGPNKTIPITDIILRRNDWAKILLYKKRNDKTRTMSGFIGAALQRI